MSKFKVGDKIRCVDSSYWSEYLTEGKVYVVMEESFNPNYVRIQPDKHETDEYVGGYSVGRFELVQESGVLTPEEVFEHLLKGTKLQIFGTHETRTGSIERWLDAPPIDLITYNTIVTQQWRIKPEPEIIELNGKKYREIVE